MAYIPSRRVIQEGGYEAYAPQYAYDHLGPFSVEIEDLIIGSVNEWLKTFIENNHMKNIERR